VLAAAHRLRRSSDFGSALRAGRRAGRGSLVVHLAVPAQAQIAHASEPARTDSSTLLVRAGFVVSKAVGGAVVRNKVKRRLRALVQDRLAGLPAGSTLVVRALPAAAAVSFVQLGRDLDAALTAASNPRRGRHTP